MIDPRAVLLVLATLIGPSWRAPLGPPRDADLNAALRALDAAEANEREQAERWLVEHLDARDDAGLRAGLVAVELGPEASWRLSRALGARSTNLGLIMDLIVGANFASGEISLDLDMLPDDDNAQTQRSLEREIGRRALEHLLATWRSGLDRLPLSGAALKPLLLEERERNPWRMLTIPDGPVADVVSRLVREGDVPIPVVMAQGLAEKLAGERFGGPFSKRVEPFRGAWDEVLLDFARAHDLAFEAVLYRGKDDVDEFAWLRLVEREAAGAESGSLQLSLALEDVARHVNRDAGGNDDVDGFAPSISTGELQLAARFLASVGWDGGLTWLGDLWMTGDTKIARTALLEGAARHRVVPLVEAENRHAEHAEFAGEMTHLVDVLLEGVADEHHRLHPLGPGLRLGMHQQAADLGLAAEAMHAGHFRQQRAGVEPPGRGVELAEAAVPGELDGQPAERRRLAEHLALDLAGPVPGRLAARRGVEREDQPPRLAARRRGHLPHPAEERVYLPGP